MRDKLTKQRELTRINKKMEYMQAKMDIMEKRVMIRGAYINLEMLGSFPFTQEVDEAVSPKSMNVTPQIQSMTGQRQTYTYASETLTY